MMPATKHEFAGFIVTYERPAILVETIGRIFDQTLIPEKLLIVDNSESKETEELIKKMSDPRIEYYRVGSNSGPAGASKLGLQWLTDQGYEWIYWGDDDDPPTFQDSFEKLFRMIAALPDKNVGIVGAVGQYFNRLSGTIVRVKDQTLREDEYVSVDSIAGGQTMIVNSNMVTKGVLPDDRLYFGFEELDFCLKAKKSGFELFVSADLFLRAREKYDRLGYSRPLYIKKQDQKWERLYYSVRNMLVILARNGLYLAFGYQIAKALLKMLFGLTMGVRYAKNNFRMLGRGIYDGLTENLGKQNLGLI